MTNQLKIEVGDTVESSVGINKGARGVCIDAYFGYKSYKISWDYYNAWVDFKDLTLIKKGKTMKEFTKSDLKTGMFVKYRSGDYRVVIGHVLSGTGCATLPQYSEDLKYRGDIYPQLDIVAVYKATRGTNIDEYLKGHCLAPIWERTEQTPAQKEMEVLQAKMDELQEQMKVVQAKL
jgi:hypothetical protein